MTFVIKVCSCMIFVTKLHGQDFEGSLMLEKQANPKENLGAQNPKLTGKGHQGTSRIYLLD